MRKDGSLPVPDAEALHVAFLAAYDLLRLWASQLLGWDWEDYAEGGILRYLEHPLPVARATDVTRVFTRLKWRTIDEIRYAKGREASTTHPRGRDVCRSDTFWRRQVAPPCLPEVRLDVARVLGGYPLRDQRILEAWAYGVPSRMIAAEEGVTESRVSQILKQYIPTWRAVQYGRPARARRTGR